jgi:WD40 repeat protein
MKLKNILPGILFLIFEIFFLASCKTDQYKNTRETGREPVIEPDYSEVTIPWNIAPMNFIIKEDGSSFRITTTSVSGIQLSIRSSDGIVRFPERSWKKLLKDNQGGKIQIEISSENKDRSLIKYNPFYLYIAQEPIDPYLCYRLLYPGYETYSQIKIIQRCIENFKETSLVENQLVGNNCVNCHSFNHNNPEKFLLHIRGSKGDTYFVDGKRITRTDLKTKEMTSGAVYPSWHPGRKYVAFSSNSIVQSFHSIPEKNIEVIDLASSLVLYDTEKNEISPIEEGDSVEYMETFPEWSPDGKYLYYCRAKQVIDSTDFKNIKYNLVRKSFDEPSRSFGKAEIVFDAQAISKSVSFPRISPDGQYLVFTLHDYGNFSIWHKEADLYLINLQNGKADKMRLNSNETESYHSWSSNGKWLVFSSKRGDGLTARPYFAYFGSPDQVGKPFVLPQRDPTLYERLVKTFNKPEFVTGKINLGPRDFERASKGTAVKAVWSGNKK